MKLLVLDIEGTLFKSNIQLPGTSIDSTIWQGIAYALGPDAIKEEVESHERWDRGGYASYVDWMRDTILIHQRQGLSESLFRELISSAEYNSGVVETLSEVNRSEYELVLISGGFRALAVRAQRDLKIHHAFAACEYFFGTDGTLEGYNLLPCDFDGKADFIRLMLKEYRLSSAGWLFVGNGRNDAPIAREAPAAVGYRPHAELRKWVKYSISEFDELPEILELEKGTTGS